MHMILQYANFSYLSSRFSLHQYYLTTVQGGYFYTLLIYPFSWKESLTIPHYFSQPLFSVCGTCSINVCEINTLMQEQNQFIF